MSVKKDIVTIGNKEKKYETLKLRGGNAFPKKFVKFKS